MLHIQHAAPSFAVKGAIGGWEVTFNTTEAKGEILTVGNGKTVKAIAVRSCFANSEVTTYRQK